MARLAPRDAGPPDAMRRLPTTAQLAALGAVLCLHRARAADPVAGWSRAWRMQVHHAVDGDGLQESLQAFDADGACDWQLHLLPDSDFLAWERLTAGLPGVSHDLDDAHAGVGERLWQALARRLRGDAWRASVVRFEPSPGAHMDARHAYPAARLASISATGADAVRRITRAHGIDAARVIDDCCCQRAAALARSGATSTSVYRPFVLGAPARRPSRP
jgi:hypothetical protein